MKLRLLTIQAILLPALLTVTPAHGGVAEFFDKDEWIAAVGPFTTIDFTGFPDGTQIMEQYADLGVHFVDHTDFVLCCSDDLFPNDGAGLDGNQGVDLVFDSPQAYIAAEFPGFLRIDLFSGGDLFYSSIVFGGVGVGWFGGLVSSGMFDAATLSDPVDGNVVIDDLHFGVPAPPTLGLLVVAGLSARRRRDSS